MKGKYGWSQVLLNRNALPARSAVSTFDSLLRVIFSLVPSFDENSFKSKEKKVTG